MINPNASNLSITVSSSTIDRGTPSVKSLRRTTSDQSCSTYKKYRPSTTLSSSPSTSMFELKRKFKYRSTSLESVENMLKQKCKLEYRRTSLEAEMNILKQKCKLEYGSTTDCGTPSTKNLQRTPSDQSSSYKKYSPATTARSNPSTLMFKQKHKSESSLETVESNTALRVSSQSNLDRDHANVGDNDTCPQVANSSSDAFAKFVCTCKSTVDNN